MTTYAWKTYTAPGRLAYYDKRQKVWVMMETDIEGNQTEEASYTPIKKLALAWVKKGKQAYTDYRREANRESGKEGG